MRKRISQKVARAAIKRVAELERERRMERAPWARNYPGGTNLCRFNLSDDRASGMLHAAQRLKHPLVAVVDGDKLHIFALPA